MHRRSRLHVGHLRWHRRRPTARTRHRLGTRFARLWGAGVVSNVADGVLFAALPLLAAVLTRDALLVALVAVVHGLPWLVFELIAGEIVDRVDRKLLMFWGNLARAATIGLLAALVAADILTIGILYVLALAIGIAETLVDTSWEALVPRLVPEDELETAFGRTQAAEWTANELAGPPLGGLLFAGAAALPFFFEMGLFLIAAGLVVSIPGTYRADREVAHGRGAVRRDIVAGIEWLWHHRLLRALSLMAGTSNLVGTAMFAVFVLFAQEILALNDAQFGLILSAAGVGGIIGAATAHRTEEKIGPGTMLIASMAGIGFMSLLIAVTSNPIVVGAAFAVDGFLIAMWNVVVVALRQALTPDDMRGRVASVARTVAFGAIPLGAALGGVLAQTISLRAPFFVAAAVYAIAVTFMTTVVSNARIEALRSEPATEE